MSKLGKNLEFIGLLVLFVLILINPYYVNNLYNTLLGRLALIIVLLYLTINNVTIGLFFALCIIISLSVFFREGFEEASVTIGEENVENKDKNKIKVLTKMEAEEDGIDRQTIEESVRAVSSKELPSSKTNDDDNVSPHDKTIEKFSCMGCPYM